MNISADSNRCTQDLLSTLHQFIVIHNLSTIVFTRIIEFRNIIKDYNCILRMYVQRNEEIISINVMRTDR